MPDLTVYTPPTAKRLVLSLLSAPNLDEITARQFARWGALFGIDAATLRVALGRMVRDDLVVTLRRGVYGIGPAGRSLSDKARSWVSAEARIGPWEGRWLLVHTAHLGRRNRTVLRTRERALRLEGFAELEAGLWCRPANYREPTAATRERMLALGLEAQGLVLRADRILGTNSDPRQLWPVADLERRYHQLVKAMDDSMQGISDLEHDEAARETFLLGEAVIRQINADPLLPDEMVDAAARRAMHEMMLAYDAVGREAWSRFQVHADAA